MLGDLHGMTARGGFLRIQDAGQGNLPNRGIVEIVAVYKVDPSAVVRPAKLAVSVYIDNEFPGDTAVWIDEVNIGFATHPRV